MKIYQLEIVKVEFDIPEEYEIQISHHNKSTIINHKFYDIPIQNKHDELFGTFHIFFRKKILFFTKNIGFVEIKNSDLINIKETKYKIICANHMGTYITLNMELKKIGNIIMRFKKKEALITINNLPKFDIFKEVLINNRIFFFVSLLVPLVEGSTTCRLKCIKGLYILIRIFFGEKEIQEDFANKLDKNENIQKIKNILIKDSPEKNMEIEKIEKNSNKLEKNENFESNSNSQIKNSETNNNFNSDHRIEENFKHDWNKNSFDKKKITKKYVVKNHEFYKKIFKNYYYSIACYTNPFILINIDPQLKLSSKNKDLKSFKRPVKYFQDQEIKCFNRENISKKKSKIIEYLNVPDDRILHISLDEKIPHIKFISKNKFIVAFRGTATINDLFSDMTCDYAEFLDGYVHRGMLDLANEFMSKNENFILENMEERKLKILKFVGHSLGGAVASITGILFKNKFKNMKIKVYAFSPAACLSLNIAKKYKFITSFIQGTDIFSRLSYGSILDFKYLTASVGGADKIIDSNSKNSLKKYIKKIKRYLRRKNIHPKLYCAGKCYHLKYIDDFLKVRKVKQRFFDSICVDINFFTDHVPSIFIKRLRDTLKKILQKNS